MAYTRAWERLCNRRRAMKHYEMVSKRTMISHLHTLCKDRRKKRYMLKALHSLQLPLDIWFRYTQLLSLNLMCTSLASVKLLFVISSYRRVEYYEIKRIFYEWKHRTFEDVDDMVCQPRNKPVIEVGEAPHTRRRQCALAATSAAT